MENKEGGQLINSDYWTIIRGQGETFVQTNLHIFESSVIFLRDFSEGFRDMKGMVYFPFTTTPSHIIIVPIL